MQHLHRAVVTDSPGLRLFSGELGSFIRQMCFHDEHLPMKWAFALWQRLQQHPVMLPPHLFPPTAEFPTSPVQVDVFSRSIVAGELLHRQCVLVSVLQ